jgi:hypothetical protein
MKGSQSVMENDTRKASSSNPWRDGSRKVADADGRGRALMATSRSVTLGDFDGVARRSGIVGVKFLGKEFRGRDF